MLEIIEHQDSAVNQLKAVSTKNGILWDRVMLRRELNRRINDIGKSTVESVLVANEQKQRLKLKNRLTFKEKRRSPSDDKANVDNSVFATLNSVSKGVTNPSHELRRSDRIAFNKGRKDLKTAEKVAEDREVAAMQKRKEKESRWSQKVRKEISKDPVRREAKRSEEYHANLENFDYLVAKHYVDPITKALYEIISVYYDRAKKIFMSMARLIDDTEWGVVENIKDIKGLQILPILGVSGTQQLNRDLDMINNKDAPAIEWPTTDQEWVVAQNSDPKLIPYLLKLKDGGSCFMGDQMNCQYVRTVDEKTKLVGPLIRIKNRVRVIKHNNSVHTIEAELQTILIPQQLVNKCIYMFHVCMGHPGVTRTCMAIKNQYHWQNINRDVKDYIKECHYCGIRKSTHLNANIPIQSYDNLMRPFDRCHIDLTGPFTRTKDGNRFILVFKDALTGWVEVFALQDKSADSVAKCLWDEVYMRHGTPRLLISDRGTEFTNKIMTDVHKILNVRHVKTTPANPQSNGLAENFMRTLKDMLVSMIDRKGDDWDDFLATVAHYYRTTINPETGMSPFFMMMGREANMPASEFLKVINLDGGLTEYAESKREVLEKLWEEHGKQIATHSHLFNRQPVKRQPFKAYKEGDYFYHRQVPRRFYRDNKEEDFVKIGSKLQFRYSGPYLINKKISDVLYEAIMHGEKIKVHAINMKMYTIDVS